MAEALMSPVLPAEDAEALGAGRLVRVTVLQEVLHLRQVQVEPPARVRWHECDVAEQGQIRVIDSDQVFEVFRH